MKLSMFILADWLEKYHPSINIKEGQPLLSGVRIYSGKDRIEDNCVLNIGRASDFYPDQFTEDQIICANRQDWLLINSKDMNMVLNDVLKAFEFYNEWETSLKETSYSNSSFQMLVDLSYPVFKNPIFMVDWYGKVLGLTSQSEAEMDGTTWDYMRTNGYLPAYVYDRVNISNEQFQQIENKKEITYLDVPQFNYHCIHCTIFIENQPVMNFEISQKETDLTEGMCQLAEILRQACLIKLQFGDATTFIPPTVLLLSDLLSGKAYNPEALRHVLFTLGWENSKNWYLTTFLNPFSGEMPRTVLLQQLEREIPRGFSFEWEGHLIMLSDCEDWDANLASLAKLLKEGSYVAGVSMPFSDYKELPVAFKQAEVAMSFSNRDSAINWCTDHAWGYMLSEFVQDFKSEGMLHPAIETLEKYDLKNGSELLKTLHTYLLNERSVIETANELFIHRNSLRYRLEQINNLIHVDLDNPEVRLYLLFSCFINERKQKTE
ncbi:MAG: helix-turn-helix domain-containing protein [Anaerolineaceae bacterium]